jgi:HSP20 family protein
MKIKLLTLASLALLSTSVMARDTESTTVYTPASKEFNQIQSNMMDMLKRTFPDSTVFEASKSYSPKLDMTDKNDKYVVTVDLPGFSKKNLSVDVDEQELIISGKRTKEQVMETFNVDTHPKAEVDAAEGEKVYHAERSFGNFKRVMSLPEKVREDDVTAEYEDGVLTIVLPKQEIRSSNKTRVKIGS